jgi:hypothetical protein
MLSPSLLFAQTNVNCHSTEMERMVKRHFVRPIFFDDPRIQTILLQRQIRGPNLLNNNDFTQAVAFCQELGENVVLNPDDIIKIKGYAMKQMVERINSFKGKNLVDRVLNYLEKSCVLTILRASRPFQKT